MINIRVWNRSGDVHDLTLEFETVPTMWHDLTLEFRNVPTMWND